MDEQNAQTLQMLDNRHFEGSSTRETSRSAPNFSALAVEVEPEKEKPQLLAPPPGRYSFYLFSFILFCLKFPV